MRFSLSLLLTFAVFNQTFSQKPIIDSLNPVNGKMGDTLTIYGLNFNATASKNIVCFETVKAEVISATSLMLKVKVPGGAQSVSKVSVIANKLYASSITSPTPYFYITTAGGELLITSDYSLKTLNVIKNTDDAPNDVASADFNNDGYPDLVTAFFFGDYITISLRNSTNTGFDSVAYYPMPAQIMTDITTGDFNNDGNFDVCVAMRDNQLIGLWLGNGDGTLTNAGTITNTDNPYRVKIGDINGDGKQDIVSADLYNTMTVYNGAGNGGFGIPSSVNFTYDNNVLATADFNKDGKEDVAVANLSNRVTVLLRDSANTGFDTISYPAKNLPMAIVAGDFNNDSTADIVTANFTSGNVSLLINKGDGTFLKQDTFLVKYSSDLAIGDFNGDGYTDIVMVAGSPPLQTLLWLNDGTGNFISQVAFSFGFELSGLCVSDFNADGYADIAVADQGGVVYILQYSGKGALTSVVNKNPDDSKVTIYPNPSSGIISIKTELQNCTVSIANSMGSLIQTFGLSAASKTINLPQGFYMVTVANAESVETRKIIIE